MKTTDHIFYKKGYKYQLFSTCVTVTNIYPPSEVDTPYINLTTEGILTVKRGYAWNGPSGPLVDTKPKQRASLNHDAFYQLFRQGLVNRNNAKKADRLFKKQSIEDGIVPWRAHLWYLALRKFGGASRSERNARAIHRAPKQRRIKK